MRFSKGIMLAAVLCLVIGFTATLQMKSVSIDKKIRNDATKAETTRMDMIKLELDNQKAINDRLNKQIEQYSSDIDEYKQQASDVDGYTKLMSTQLERAKLMAGLTEVTGPGVTITVTDKQTETPATVDNVNLYVVHQDDLLRIVNELCDSDAEAISINGERIVANSEIRCAGATVSVNNRRYSAPFVIKAIGNPDNLAGALNMRDGVVETLSDWLSIDIVKKDSLTIPAYAGNVNYKYAKTVTKEAE